MAIDRNDYVDIAGWMITDLGLKGNEIIVYALIWSYSRAKGQRFYGSTQYIADWINADRRTVLNILNSLIKKGLIIKGEEERLGRKYSYYSVVNKEV